MKYLFICGFFFARRQLYEWKVESVGFDAYISFPCQSLIYTMLGYKLRYHIIGNSRLTTYSSFFYFRD
jgi:hypothetical protein